MMCDHLYSASRLLVARAGESATGCYLLFSLAAVMVWVFPAQLACISRHGKMSSTTPDQASESSSSASSLLSRLTVPKSYFNHMYAMGLAALIPFLPSPSAATAMIMDHSVKISIEHYALVCLGLHLLRRLVECLCFTNYGVSKIHVGGYLAGLAHYLLLPVSIHAGLHVQRIDSQLSRVKAVVALALFCAASCCQFSVHAQLAAWKKQQQQSHQSMDNTMVTQSRKANARYPLPRGGFFALVACPHYTAEVAIYFSLWMLQPTSLVLSSLLLWVAVNLGVVAEQQLAWYRGAYGVASADDSSAYKKLAGSDQTVPDNNVYKPSSSASSFVVSKSVTGLVPRHWGGWLPCLCSSCMSALVWGRVEGDGERTRRGSPATATRASTSTVSTLSTVSVASCMLLLALMSPERVESLRPSAKKKGSSTTFQRRSVPPAFAVARALQRTLLQSTVGDGTTLPGADATTWSSQVSGLTQDEIMLKDMCILVDTSDRIIGQATKHDAHRFTAANKEGLLHRAFSVFLFDSQNRLLLQQRASDKITFPDVWTNTCCSHPLYGYTPSEVDTPEDIAAGRCPGIKAAAVRKMEHELGLRVGSIGVSVDDMRFVTRLRYSAADRPQKGADDQSSASSASSASLLEEGWTEAWGESEVDYIVFLRAHTSLSDLQPNPSEVKDVRFVTPTEFRAMLANKDLTWSPWFRIIVDRFLWKWWDNLDAVTAGKAEWMDWAAIHAF